MIQAKLSRDDLLEEEWAIMNEEIEECKKKGLEDQTALQEKSAGETGDDKKCAEPGRSRTRSSHLKAAICARRTELFRELGPHVGGGLGKQSSDTTVAESQHCPADQRDRQSRWHKREENYDRLRFWRLP